MKSNTDMEQSRNTSGCSPVFKELELKKKQNQESHKGVKVLRCLLLLKSGSTSQKQQVRELLKLNKGAVSNVSDASLEDVYKQVCEMLNVKYQPETSRTFPEKIFKSEFKKYTRVDIFSSVWIGAHCVDLFIPRARIAVEINGYIHDREFKMLKDNHKESCLGQLNIMSYNVNNNDVVKEALTLASLTKERKHIGSVNVKRLWRDIYIHTIASNTPFEELDLLFEYEKGTFEKAYSFISVRGRKIV